MVEMIALEHVLAKRPAVFKQEVPLVSFNIRAKTRKALGPKLDPVVPRSTLIRYVPSVSVRMQITK